MIKLPEDLINAIVAAFDISVCYILILLAIQFIFSEGHQNYQFIDRSTIEYIKYIYSQEKRRIQLIRDLLKYLNTQ
jgi:hypothetical protein